MATLNGEEVLLRVGPATGRMSIYTQEIFLCGFDNDGLHLNGGCYLDGIATAYTKVAVYDSSLTLENCYLEEGEVEFTMRLKDANVCDDWFLFSIADDGIERIDMGECDIFPLDLDHCIKTLEE